MHCHWRKGGSQWGWNVMARHGKGLTATKQLTHVCAALRKEYDLNLVFIFCPGFRCVTIWQTNDYSPVVVVDPWACETRHCLPIMDLTAVQKRICIAVCPQCHVVIVTDEDKSCPFPWSPYIVPLSGVPLRRGVDGVLLPLHSELGWHSLRHKQECSYRYWFLLQFNI